MLKRPKNVLNSTETPSNLPQYFGNNRKRPERPVHAPGVQLDEGVVLVLPEAAATRRAQHETP